MKNVYIATKRLSDANGVIKDAEGAFYLEEQSHKVFSGKEFTSPGEAIQAVNDYNRENPGDKFKGEVIFINVIEF